MTLRILADDLTGALDSAAPFATAADPVRLLYRAASGARPMLTLSTESRDLSEGAADKAVIEGVRRLSPRTNPDTLWFKKVDSVLRGHPLTETLAMLQAGGLARCIFAPAFPDMGRITRDGRQWVRAASGDWIDTPWGDLRRAFARLSPTAGITVLDATSQAELRAAIQPWRGLPGTLWAGSRGLAEALSPAFTVAEMPRIGLFILGTSHPATRAQARELASVAIPAAHCGNLTPAAMCPVVLDPVPDHTSGAETRAALAAAIPRLRPSTDGSAVFVTGGDTLAELLDRAKVEALDCIGEVAPGLPLSRVIGGPLAEMQLITKSGGFGPPALLRDLVRIDAAT